MIEELVIPLTLYLHPQASIDSAQIQKIVEEAKLIWRVANISLEADVLPYPSLLAWPILVEDLVDYFRLNPPGSTIIGTYGEWNGGDNGLSYPHQFWDTRNSSVPILPFFVRDHTEGSSPPLARVTAHEIGHLLRLPHYFNPRENLMARGSHGTDLEPLEIKLARAGARWLLRRLS